MDSQRVKSLADARPGGPAPGNSWRSATSVLLSLLGVHIASWGLLFLGAVVSWKIVQLPTWPSPSLSAAVTSTREYSFAMSLCATLAGYYIGVVHQPSGVVGGRSVARAGIYLWQAVASLGSCVLYAAACSPVIMAGVAAAAHDVGWGTWLAVVLNVVVVGVWPWIGGLIGVLLPRIWGVAVAVVVVAAASAVSSLSLIDGPLLAVIGLRWDMIAPLMGHDLHLSTQLARGCFWGIIVGACAWSISWAHRANMLTKGKKLTGVLLASCLSAIVLISNTVLPADIEYAIDDMPLYCDENEKYVHCGHVEERIDEAEVLADALYIVPILGRADRRYLVVPYTVWKTPKAKELAKYYGTNDTLEYYGMGRSPEYSSAVNVRTVVVGVSGMGNCLDQYRIAGQAASAVSMGQTFAVIDSFGRLAEALIDKRHGREVPEDNPFRDWTEQDAQAAMVAHAEEIETCSITELRKPTS